MGRKPRKTIQPVGRLIGTKKGFCDEQTWARRLVKDGLYIEAESAHAATAVAYSCRAMLMATLPHSKQPGTEYERKNGDLVLRVSAPRWGVPYGPKPRLLCYWLATQIVKTKSREIELGGSLSEWLRKLGLERTGREIAAVKEQTKRLFDATIDLNRYDHGSWTLYRMNIAAAASVWWDVQAPDQIGLWGSRVKVGQEFFDECLRSPVPLDGRALRALKGSSFDLDLYGWAVARLFTVRKPTLISWELLRLQFGAGYPATKQGLRHFREKFAQRLQRVLMVYPGAKMWPDDDGVGLWLDTSPPAVQKRVFHNPM